MKRIIALVLALVASTAVGAVDIPVRNASGGAYKFSGITADASGACSSNGNVCSGTYTPTVGTKQNVTTASAAVFGWIRVGNQLYVSGIIGVSGTSTGTYTHLNLTLPFTRPSGNFGSIANCAGTGAANTSVATANQPWAVTAVSGSQNVDMLVPGVVATGNVDIYVSFGCQL